MKNYSKDKYEDMIQRLFSRFQSFQKVGAGAYKPGIANMEFADQLLGHPHRSYKVIHVAGTNGKGSVSNMLASVLSASGMKVGLYTSPHISDFRERIRVVNDDSYDLIPEEAVWDFVQKWNETFDHLDMSFFEITTLMAFDWFAGQQVDVAVVETGLGGRLDSTNIVSPILSVITNIGLDHCDLLGETLPEIAFEKAGIIKPKVPVVVGESDPEINSVFERKVLYTNLSEPFFSGDRTAIMSLLTFADKVAPTLWERRGEILSQMDLQGVYQEKNLRTVLAAIDVLCSSSDSSFVNRSRVSEAIMNAASRTGFRGRWEKLSENPWIICDIGHNEHGLKYNFSQLAGMLADGRCTHLIMVYGSVADKDVDAVLHLLPAGNLFIFTQAQGKRALSSDVILARYRDFCCSEGCPAVDACSVPSVADAVALAKETACRIMDESPDSRPLIYVGGSTYVVSEAVSVIK